MLHILALHNPLHFGHALRHLQTVFIDQSELAFGGPRTIYI
jgi:hypothetical protein